MRLKLTDLRGAARLIHIHLALGLPEARAMASSYVQHYLIGFHGGFTQQLNWEATIRRTFGAPMALARMAEDRSYDGSRFNPDQSAGFNQAWPRRWVSEHAFTMTALPYDADRARCVNRIRNPF